MHISKAQSLMWISDLEKLEEAREILSNWSEYKPREDLAVALKTLDNLIAATKAYQQSPAYGEHLDSISRD